MSDVEKLNGQQRLWLRDKILRSFSYDTHLIGKEPPNPERAEAMWAWAGWLLESYWMLGIGISVKAQGAHGWIVQINDDTPIHGGPDILGPFLIESVTYASEIREAAS